MKIRVVQQLPAVALAPHRRVRGQGVHIPGVGPRPAGEGKLVGQQGHHGGQPVILQQQKHVLRLPAALKKPVDIPLVVPKGQLPQPLLGLGLLRPGGSDVYHGDAPFHQPRMTAAYFSTIKSG